MSIKFEKLSVLIVEDTEPLRRLIVTALEALGAGRVYSAHDGEDALALLKKYAPDIALIDWHLPGMTGLELVEKIRKSYDVPDRMIPIIMMTGYSSAEKIAQARDAGVTEYLAKPFEADALIKRVHHVIQTPRDFIDCETYFGPDRRRTKNIEYRGPYRRKTDKKMRKFFAA